MIERLRLLRKKLHIAKSEEYGGCYNFHNPVFLKEDQKVLKQ